MLTESPGSDLVRLPGSRLAGPFSGACSGPPGRQRGIALVLVLWILILLTVTTGAFALMARMDQLEANQLLSGTKARFWAEADTESFGHIHKHPPTKTKYSPTHHAIL